MAKPNETYHDVIVESYKPSNTSGLHGEVHIRPIKGEQFPQDTHVSCSKKLSNTSVYPLGTKFKIQAKLTDRENGKPYLFSYRTWPFTVV
jgi:hypothetical protein